MLKESSSDETLIVETSSNRACQLQTFKNLKIMTLIKKSSLNVEKITVDLTGQEGNAFVLLGYAKKWGRQLGYSMEVINEIISDMKSSDYNHLIRVIDKEFGEYVNFLTF